MFTNPARPSAFSTLQKLWKAAVVGMTGTPKSVDALRTRLEKQDGYTLYRTVRNFLARNSCTVTKVINYTNISLIKLPIVISTISLNFSGHGSFDNRHGALAIDRFGLLDIWKTLEAKRRRVTVTNVMFIVG